MTLAEEDLAHNPLVKFHLLAEVESALILFDGPGVVALLVLAFSLKKVDRKPVLFHHFFANLQRLGCLVNEAQFVADLSYSEIDEVLLEGWVQRPGLLVVV